MLHDKIHIHDWVNFDHTVTKNMGIGDLKFYTHVSKVTAGGTHLVWPA